MTHRDLCFKILYGLKNNTYYDEQGRTAEGDISDGHQCVDNKWEYCDYAKEERTYKSDLAKHFLNEVARGLSGTYTRYKSAVLLQIIGNFNGIELNGCPEIREEDYQYEVQDNIYGRSKREEIVYSAPEGAVGEEACNSCGKRYDGRSKNDGHNA